MTKWRGRLLGLFSTAASSDVDDCEDMSLSSFLSNTSVGCTPFFYLTLFPRSSPNTQNRETM